MNKQLNRMWRQMTADKKRFGIMCVCLAAGLLLWGRLILLEKVPRIATADPELVEPQAEAPPARPARERPAVAIDLPDTLAMDLFELRPNRYKPISDPTLGEDEVQEDQGPTDEWLQREALKDAARELTLDGVIRGEPSFAIINGVRVYVGGRIHGFVLTGLSYQQRKVRLTSELFEDLVVILKMSDG
ncbi:MAG: hypothetical protein ACIAXF_03515 [Phycisphaerales bacterium JB063]